MGGGLAILCIAYLLGSIPFGYLIVRIREGADVRETGSGGTGATNVSRRAGKGAGIVTLVLDALKGATAVLLAQLVFDPSHPTEAWWIAGAAILAIIGHMFPVWLKFRGGKGVATGVGVFMVLAPFPLAGASAIFLLIAVLTRYVSLGSIVAASTIPLFVWLQHGLIRPVPSLWPTMSAGIVGAALIIFAHRANIQRLLQGTETKFS